MIALVAILLATAFPSNSKTSWMRPESFQLTIGMPRGDVVKHLEDSGWKIKPGKVFDLTLPLDQVAEGYRAMDERRAIKTLLRP